MIGLDGIAGTNQAAALFHKRTQVGFLVRADLPDIAVQHDHPLRCQRMAGLLATRKEILRADRVVIYAWTPVLHGTHTRNPGVTCSHGSEDARVNDPASAGAYGYA